MLKKAFSSSFSMKDMGPVKQILGMHIVRDRTKGLLWLSHEKYVTGALEIWHGKCKIGRVNTVDRL